MVVQVRAKNAKRYRAGAGHDYSIRQSMSTLLTVRSTSQPLRAYEVPWVHSVPRGEASRIGGIWLFRAINPGFCASADRRPCANQPESDLIALSANLFFHNPIVVKSRIWLRFWRRWHDRVRCGSARVTSLRFIVLLLNFGSLLY